jgi:predicted transposase YbfD/YdcC
MVESGNHYLGALKGNQGNLHQSVQAHFVAEESFTDISKD